MVVPWNNIKQNKPAFFDCLVLTVSLFLGLIFPRLSDLTTSTSFSGWMLAVLILYLVGLWLKHMPVYHRLAKISNRENDIPLIIILSIGHWIIMLFVLFVAEGAFRFIIGLPKVSGEESRSGMQMVSIIFAATVITWFAFRSGRKIKKQVTEKYFYRRELAGDIFLITAVSFFSFVFWEKSLVGAFAQMRMDSFGNIFLLFLFLSFAYILFYLPLRYLYLIEDRFSRQAWKRLLFIFLLILIRGLLGSV